MIISLINKIDTIYLILYNLGMFIRYEKIGNLLYKLTKNESLKTFFYNKKVEQNLNYISKNKPLVLNKLKEKLNKGKKLNVIFYVYDETKWKCQSLYDLFTENSMFNPMVIVTKNSAKNADNPSYQTEDDVKRAYDFFKNKGMNVQIAYKNKKFVPFKNFSPDIIIYQHPWYVETSQGPVVCSKFALTCYVPYYFPIETAEIDYNLRFHKYVENYYILNEYTKNKYETKSGHEIKNLKPLGYPHLDYFIKNSPIDDGEFIIYAPHWTVAGRGLAYGTFDWNGKFILEFAKKHPETKWVYKPHPLLKKALSDTGIMTEREADEYYEEWAKIGIKYEGGDYLELFNKSKMMVTDCSSFLGEYFVTGKPLIHIMSEKSQFRNSENPILKAYYRVENIEDLENLLNKLPQEDYMKDLRTELLEQSGLKNNYCAESIMHDILKEIR